MRSRRKTALLYGILVVLAGSGLATLVVLTVSGTEPGAGTAWVLFAGVVVALAIVLTLEFSSPGEVDR